MCENKRNLSGGTCLRNTVRRIPLCYLCMWLSVGVGSLSEEHNNWKLRRRNRGIQLKTIHSLISGELPFWIFWQFILRNSCQHWSISIGGEAGGYPHQRCVGVHGGAGVCRHLFIRNQDAKRRCNFGSIIANWLYTETKPVEKWYWATEKLILFYFIYLLY